MCPSSSKRRKAHLKLRCAPGQHVTLTDIRGLDSLAQETADAFTTLLTDPQSRARRLAFVLPARQLLRGQLMRILGGRESGYFTDTAAAEAWLLDDAQLIGVHTESGQSGGEREYRPGASDEEHGQPSPQRNFADRYEPRRHAVLKTIPG
jgi:hypothetical protein